MHKIMFALAIIIMFVLIYLIITNVILQRKYSLLLSDMMKMHYRNKVVMSLLRFLINEKGLVTFVRKLEVKNLCIYGMSDIGELITEDLLAHSDEINLLYGIDNRACEIDTYIPVYTLDEIPDEPKPEMVIVSVLGESGKKLKQDLSQQLKCLVFLVEDIIYE